MTASSAASPRGVKRCSIRDNGAFARAAGFRFGQYATDRSIVPQAATSMPTTLDRATLNLGLIGNCAISALVDPRGAIIWCCMPRFDGDPIFHALLDSADGLPEEAVLSVDLEGFARSEQAYEPGTAILHTRL